MKKAEVTWHVFLFSCKTHHWGTKLCLKKTIVIVSSHNDSDTELRGEKSAIYMMASKPNLMGLRASSPFFSPLFSPMKNSPQPPLLPDNVCPLCISNTENWHAINEEIFKGRPGRLVSHRGLLFTPSPLVRNQNSLDVTRADWSSLPALERSLAPTMASFIRAVSQALVTGQRHRAPSGPNQCWGPQERAIKRPYKTMLSPCIVELRAHPPLITWLIARRHTFSSLFELWCKAVVLYF